MRKQRSDSLLPSATAAFTVRLRAHLTELTTSEAGQGLTEYALILAFIAMMAIAALTFLSGGADSVMSTIGSSLAK